MMRMLSTKMMATFRACALLSLPFLIFAVLPTSAIAEDEGGTFDPYPLRPADTSSPRDTLRNFNTNINEAVQAWEARQPEATIRRASRRAHETLDFSQLPKRGKRTQVIESVLLLKEILDRIGPSLVVTALTDDEAFTDRLLSSPNVERLNIGPIPTNQISWDQPHEGNLFDHLYRRRALQWAKRA